MITLVFFAKRRAGLSADEFHAHWRDRHGPLVADALGSHLVSYHQLHRQRPAVRTGGHHADDTEEPEFDGVAILQLASPEAFRAFLADPAYAARVAPDEDAFIDKAASKLLLCDPALRFVGDGFVAEAAGA